MKTLAFGDSFVKMFIHCPDVKHFKFKGKSIKGLVKDTDDERAKIERQTRKTPNAKRVLLIFGQVDFNYVRYYKVIKGEPPFTKETFRDYVQWVSTINSRSNISIVSIFPSPILEEHLIFSLVSKGSYLAEERTPEIDAMLLEEYKRSHDVWITWNSWIAEFCKEYKVNNLRLFEEDVVEPQFRDLSNVTVHLRYVPVLKRVQKFIPITFDEEKAEIQERTYEKEKLDRIAQSIYMQKTEKKEQSDKEEELVTQEPSSTTRDVDSPQTKQYFNSTLQKVGPKNRKNTADEKQLTPEKNPPKNKETFSDSDKQKPKKTIYVGKKVEPETKKTVEKMVWKKAPLNAKKTMPVTKYVEALKPKIVEPADSSEDEADQFLALAQGKKRY